VVCAVPWDEEKPVAARAARKPPAGHICQVQCSTGCSQTSLGIPGAKRRFGRISAYPRVGAVRGTAISDGELKSGIHRPGGLLIPDFS
jgi:hypothetical protein